MSRVLYSSLIVIAFAGIAPCQDSAARFRQPLLGYAAGPDGVRPIMGVPGAAMLGPWNTCPAAQTSAFSFRRGYGIAVEEGSLLLVRAGVEGCQGTPLSFGPAGRVAISPSGTAAALFHQEDGSVEVLTGLPDAPSSMYRRQAPNFAEAVQLLAVSDSGLVLLSGAGDPLTLRVISTDGARIVALPSAVQALAFPPNQDEPLILTQAGGFRLTDAGNPHLQPLGMSLEISEPRGMAFSSKGDRLFVATAEGTLHVLDLAGGAGTTVSCGCRPTALEPLAGDAVFALPQESNRMLLLDADRATPRVLFVPEFVSEPVED